MKNRLTVLSYGGGQDSFCILSLLENETKYSDKYINDHVDGGKLLVVMSDTGDEHPYTYEHIKKVRAICNNTKNFEFHFITSDMGFHRPSWPDLITPQLRDEGEKYRPTMVQSGTKSCTLQLKVDPIYKWLDEYINNEYGYGFKVQGGRGCLKKALKQYHEDFGAIDVMIGFAHGEESRVKKAMALQASPSQKWQGYINRVFPLVDLAIDRSKAQKMIRSYGYACPPPSNCMRCPYMSLQEILWLWREYPQKFEEWCHIEERKLARDLAKGPQYKADKKTGKDKLIPNHGVYNSKKTLRDKLEQAQAKHGSMTSEDLFIYKFSHGCTKNGF